MRDNLAEVTIIFLLIGHVLTAKSTGNTVLVRPKSRVQTTNGKTVTIKNATENIYSREYTSDYTSMKFLIGKGALPAEKGELGIPEQFMKVRHGVYKGNVAVFVDSLSQEEVDDVKSSSTSTHQKMLPAKTETTTTTTRRPMSTTKTSTIKTTRKSATTRPSTTTQRPTSPPQLPPTRIPPTKIIKPSTTLKKATVPSAANISPEKQISSSCLHLGKHCRRHNDCCTHHCNWRMGMKCDYTW